MCGLSHSRQLHQRLQHASEPSASCTIRPADVCAGANLLCTPLCRPGCRHGLYGSASEFALYTTLPSRLQAWALWLGFRGIAAGQEEDLLPRIAVCAPVRGPHGPWGQRQSAAGRSAGRAAAAGRAAGWRAGSRPRSPHGRCCHQSSAGCPEKTAMPYGSQRQVSDI